MSYTLKTQQIAVKDPDTGTYSGVDVLTEQTKSGLLAEIQAEGAAQRTSVTNTGTAQVSAVQTKGAETLASIPSDYTTLSNEVDDLKNTLNAFDDYFENGSFKIYPRMIVGKAIRTTNGTVWNNGLSVFAATDFIPVPSGAKRIISNAVAGGTQIGLAFYSEPSESGFIPNASLGGYSSFSFSINPDSFKYFRFTANSADGFSDIYYEITDKYGGIEGVSADIESLDKFGTLWTDGFVGNDGVYVNNSNYAITSYIPVKVIEKIATSISLNVAIYVNDGTFIMQKNYPANSEFVLPTTDNYSFVRLWYTKENSTDISSELKITFGEPVFPRCGYGLINQNTGSISINKDYVVTDYIPIGIVEKVTCESSFQCDIYDDSKSIITVITFPAGENIMPHNIGYAYMRIWTNGTDIKSFLDGINFCFGTKELSNIAMPSKEYMLSGVEYDLFYANIVDNKEAICRIEGLLPATSYTQLINTDRACFIERPENVPNQKLYTRTFAYTNRPPLQSKETDIVLSNMTTDTGDLYVQVMGDSFTDGSPAWFDYIIRENLCPNIHFVGMCKCNGLTGQYHEGRGGWTMAMYTQPATGTGLEGRVYAGFWQPNSNYKYWGDVRFWKNVKDGVAAVSDFDGEKFDQNGYLINPTTDDIMYNGTNFIKWDGSDWVSVNQTDYTWGFDYAKYLTMWDITTPSICAVMLGMNDFREAIFTKNEWDAFKGKLNSFIASYMSAVPSGKFVAVIHCTDVGGNGINPPTRIASETQNYMLWQYRQKMIETYDERESEDIYLCDAGIMVDGVYGYETVSIKPFSTYAGNKRIDITVNAPHPVLSYPAMSLPLAAIIQHLRSQ